MGQFRFSQLILLILFFHTQCSKLREPAVELSTDGGKFSITSRYVGLKNINTIAHILRNNKDLNLNLAEIPSTSESIDYFDDPAGSGVVTKIEGTTENTAKIALYINNYNSNFFTIRTSIDNLSDSEIIVKGFFFAVDGNNGSEVSGANKIDGMLSNGYQSWMPAMVSKMIDATGTDESVFDNVENNEDTFFVDFRTSWWFSALYSPEQSIITGTLTAERFKIRILNYLVDGKLTWKVKCGKTSVNNFSAEDKIVLHPGESTSSETIFIGIYTDPLIGFDEYGRAIASMNPAPGVPFIPIGWNSWNELFSNIDETKILQNAQFIKDNFPEHSFNNIQIDDGWEKSWGDWEPNEKFPSGMDGLAGQLKNMGFIPGIWLAPFLVSDSAPIYTQHNDWLLRDENGTLLKYDKYYILDTTNPEALNWLLSQIQKIVSWGYRYLKLDFLFAGDYEAKRFNGKTSMQAYRDTMRRILEETNRAGAYVLACGAPILPTAGLAHGIRIGGDIALNPIPYSFSFIKNEARNIALRSFLNRIFANDPDTALLRDVPLEEARMNLTSALLSGKIFAIGDNLPSLTQDKIEMVKKIKDFPIFNELKNPATKFLMSKPIDLFNNFSESSVSVATLFVYPETYYVPSVWAVKLNDTSAVVGLFNWENEPRQLKFSVSAAELKKGKTYSAEELWSGSVLPAVTDSYETNIEAHTVELIYLSAE